MATRRRINPYYSNDEITRAGRRPSREVNTREDEMPFVKVAKAAVGVIHDAIQRIGTAVIGPDQSGNARGDRAFDLQAERLDPSYVASGARSICIGNNLRAEDDAVAIGQGGASLGSRSVSVGSNANATVSDSVAVGAACDAFGVGSVAIGESCFADRASAVAIGSGAVASNFDSAQAIGRSATANAYRAIALGVGSFANVTDTIQIAAAHIIKRGDGALIGDWFQLLSGVECILTTDAINLVVVGDYTITLPSGCKFWLTEVGLIVTALNTLTVQPTVRFGISGALAKHRAAAITTQLTAAGKRERWTPLVPQDGEVSLSFGATVGATATTLRGRAYWKGILVEDEEP